MKFIDEAQIKVRAGRGGNGIISFRREFRVDRGGPDGGDGGRGGSIFFEGSSGINTLLFLRYQKNIIGNNGSNGKRKNMYGAKGKDIVIKVPLGTIVYKRNQILVDIVKPKKYLIAQGGIGGRGNTKFKTARNTAPKLSENGAPGEAYTLKLVLKIIANIGLVGKPSAGKSTLLSKISNAKPKIADYDFTTLTPQLGIVAINEHNSLVVADLPGLIEGAADGKGLGHMFLRHIERCKVIAHIVDFGMSKKDPLLDFETINNELKKYSLDLANRVQIVIANKMDNIDVFKANVKKFKAKYSKVDLIPISALQEKGLLALKHKLLECFQKAQTTKINKSSLKSERHISLDNEQDIIIEKPFRGMFELKGYLVRRIYDRIPLTSWENFQRFNELLKREGVWKQLISKGVKSGDTVRVFGYEFQWQLEEY